MIAQVHGCVVVRLSAAIISQAGVRCRRRKVGKGIPIKCTRSRSGAVRSRVTVSSKDGPESCVIGVSDDPNIVSKKSGDVER